MTQPQSAAVANLDVVGSVAQPQDAAATNLDIVERASITRLVDEVAPGDVAPASDEDAQQRASTLGGRVITAASQADNAAVDFPGVDMERHEFRGFGIMVSAVTDLLAQRRASLMADYTAAAGGGDAAASGSGEEAGPGEGECVACYASAPVAVFCGRGSLDGCRGLQRLCLSCYHLCGARCPTRRGHLPALVGREQASCGSFGGQAARPGGPRRKAATSFVTGRCNHH